MIFIINFGNLLLLCPVKKFIKLMKFTPNNCLLRKNRFENGSFYRSLSFSDFWEGFLNHHKKSSRV